MRELLLSKIILRYPIELISIKNNVKVVCDFVKNMQFHTCSPHDLDRFDH